MSVPAGGGLQGGREDRLPSRRYKTFLVIVLENWDVRHKNLWYQLLLDNQLWPSWVLIPIWLHWAGAELRLPSLAGPPFPTAVLHRDCLAHLHDLPGPEGCWLGCPGLVARIEAVNSGSSEF